MDHGEGEEGENGDEDDLHDGYHYDPYPVTSIGEDDVEDEVDELNDAAGAVYGHDQGAVWVHHGQSVQDPDHAVYEGCKVGNR